MATFNQGPRGQSRSRSVLGIAGIALALVCAASACSGGYATTPVTPAAVLPPGSNVAAHPAVTSTPTPAPTPTATSTATAPPAAASPTASAGTSSAATPTATPSASPSPSPSPTPAIVPFATGLGIDTSTGDPNYGQYTLPFGALSSSATLTLMPAYAAFTMTLDPATCGTGISAVVQIAQQAPNTFTVTSNAAGRCKATVTSASAVGTVLWFTVNQTGVTVQ